MKEAFYYQGPEARTKLFVLKENEDGTVDLGNADGTLLVGGCPLATAGVQTEAGQAYILPEEEESKGEDTPQEPPVPKPKRGGK